MKRSLISKVQRRVAAPGVMLFLIIGSVTACNTKSPSVALPKNGTSESEQIGDQNYNDGDSVPNALPAAPLPSSTPTIVQQPAPTPDNEAVTPPAVVTGSPATENQKSNGDQVIPNGRYFIKAAGSKKCLGLPNNSKDNGVQLQQFSCDLNNASQKFDVYIMEGGYFRITNFGTGKSLEIRDQMPVPQAAVQQNDYFAKPYQQFIIEQRSDQNYHIITLAGRMFVDLAGASVSDGAPVQLWSSGGTISGAWVFEPTY